VVVNEITIVGSRCGLFQRALDYMNSKAGLSSLIESIFPANKGLDAFDKAKIKGSKKVLIDFR
jgi:hypothetical protein